MELNINSEDIYINNSKEKINNENDTKKFEDNVDSKDVDSKDVDNKDVKTNIHYDTLVLSGGSSKGIIILGCIQYLVDNYLLKGIETYIGTSVGSIICFLLLF